ncbi:hypothetical protein ABG067_002016 [Albugo candida]
MSITSLLDLTWISLEDGEQAIRAAALSDGFPGKVARSRKVGNRPENEVRVKVFKCEHAGSYTTQIAPKTQGNEAINGLTVLSNLGITARRQVASLHNAAVPPRTISSMLQCNDQSFCATAKDVNNITQALRWGDLVESTPLEDLLDKLLVCPRPELHRVRRNDTNQLIPLLVLPSSSKEITEHF